MSRRHNAPPNALRLHRRSIRLEWLTLGWNVVEAGVAIGAGIISGSTALIAFGGDSLLEITSGGIMLWRLYEAGPEASAQDRGLAERRALYVIAGTFFVLAAYVSFDGIRSLVAHAPPDTSTIGLVLSVLSLLAMPALAYTKQRTGRRMQSEALVADAAENWVCVLLSIALLAGVGLHLAFGWWWADPVGALLMLPVVLRQGWETLGEAHRTV